MTAETTTSLKMTRLIKATPDAVFRAWTEPEQLKQWSSPEDTHVSRVEVDLTIGGRYRIHMRRADGGEHIAVGTYQEINRPHRLRYTWQWEEEGKKLDIGHDAGQTLVTVDFVEANGNTEVTLTQEFFPNEESRAGHAQGWASCLDRLETLLG